MKKWVVGVENRLYGADKGGNGQLNVKNGWLVKKMSGMVLESAVGC